MSWPSTVTLPELAVTMPQTMLISVVLPAPLGPSSARISPLRISRSMACRAVKPDAYVFETFLTERMEGMARSIPRLRLSCRRVRNRPLQLAALVRAADAQLDQLHHRQC